MKLAQIHSVYFIGIGGIGMSAIARWFNARGAKVAGYDKVSTDLTKSLESEGIEVHYQDDISLIPDWAKDQKNTLVIYTPAIPTSHTELNYFQNSGFILKKRAEVLGIITQDHYTVAVAGTHGKTTTSSMVAHLLSGGEKGCSAFVGGIMTNTGSNLIIGQKNAPVVVEADEFDRSFLKLYPDFSVVTSLDPDHLDIYGNAQSMHQSYLDFMQLTDSEGKVLLQENVAEIVGQKLAVAFETFGLKTAQIRAENIRIEKASFRFDYVGKITIRDLSLKLPGYHNVSNAVAAITVAVELGMSADVISTQLSSYLGVKRRFEYIYHEEDGIYIDDYAHHPSEIEAFLQSVKALYPGKKLLTVFQPHLFTRTRDFVDGFAQSLDLSDEVILLDIYPAREEAISGVTSKIIFDKMKLSSKHMLSKQDFPQTLDQFDFEVLVTIGAGDIDTLVPQIKTYFTNRMTSEA
ncbi:MAG: UDP-N-acetylmuramate--L-alanine ligase [Cyclobacteriaceae bacterium]|nr:UDP-N-acetylmuramate--L-alanine ligase [Cyclobacteriaceae bacterium HetDA_MAG_MS6]